MKKKKNFKNNNNSNRFSGKKLKAQIKLCIRMGGTQISLD